ncbi:pyrimidine-nucleoside phosphorylase [Mycoplasmatota bacterium]|nr:pyrimidine-nucleoside phosphorylase [Mycoplasmatota bacterium]
MRFIDVITKKRNGKVLSSEEIDFFIKSYTQGEIPDYQVSALLMAIYFNGMNHEEATHLALAMRDSGDVMDLSQIKGVKVDKHSTGGVGDKVTLVLAPIVASLGAKVAKMSGRGLGHTGGTIDKLESIKGFHVELSPDAFIEQVKDIGISVIGQSGDIAPADKKLYALRDVTATVDIIPLIASSIMSKKLASGADAICLDVKVGHGAFMKNTKDATELAQLMVDIGRLAGKKVTAILTNMNQPLGHKIGNALEVYEAMETLKGRGPSDLLDVVTTIASQLLKDANIAKDDEEAKQLITDSIQSGKAYQKFEAFVKAQGGDISVLEHFEDFLSSNKVEVISNKDGYIIDMDALSIGNAAMLLGAGRETKADVIDMSVGIDLHKKIGDHIAKGDVIATLYVNQKGIEEAKSLVLKAITTGKDKVEQNLIRGIVR